MTKYDEYGVLKTTPWSEIKKGDMVKFITTELKVEAKKTISFKRTLIGQWDGEKVEFNDPQHYVVRTTRWLTKI